MIKHKLCELLKHKSDHFIMIVDMQILRFFKCSDKILTLADMLQTQRV